MLVSMASSSSCSSNIQSKSGPIDDDILWMQAKHVSEHIWNEEEDRKLHIRRVVSTYQGQEEIPEKIIHLLWQSGLRVDRAPLIGSTNLDWVDLCEELLGVRPQECELQEMCSATDYKTKSIGGMCILLQLWAWERCTTLAPKRTPPVIENKPLGHRWLRRGNQHIGNDDLIVFRRKLDIMKRHEPYATTVMSVLPPICLIGSVAWCTVVPLICFHVVEWHQPDRVLRQFRMQQPIPGCPSQPVNIHGITLKGKQDENWKQLFAPIISQWNNRDEFRVDAEVAETLQYMVSPQGRNTWTIDDLMSYVEKITILSKEQERIIEPVSHGPASERQFLAQEFHILQSSVETQGIGRRREAVEAEEYSQQMVDRGHGMYYMPPKCSQYSSQMYQYPFEGHHTDTSASEHSFGGVAETHPHFSWPTMTPSEQHDAPIATPNARINPDCQVRRWDRPCVLSTCMIGLQNLKAFLH
ncbi:Serine/threonine-protein phosphatase 7 long form [Glycine soja]